MRRLSPAFAATGSVFALGLVLPPGSAAACAGPMLAVGRDPAMIAPPTPAVVGRETLVVVNGAWFHDGCEDTPCSVGSGCGASGCRHPDEETPMLDVPLRLVQGSRTWELGRADAREPGWTITWQVQLPRDLRRGQARFSAGRDGRVVEVDVTVR